MAIDIAKLVKKMRKANQENDGSGGSGGGNGGGGSGGGNVKYVMPPNSEDLDVKDVDGDEPVKEIEREKIIDRRGGGQRKTEEFDDDEMKIESSDRKKIELIREKEPGEWIRDDHMVDDDDETQRDIEISYPVIPNDPDPDERVFASVTISYDEEKNSLIYRVHEPELTERNEKILDRIENILKEQLDVRFDQLKHEEAKEYMREEVRKLLDNRNFGLSPDDKEIIQYYAYRNFVGLEKLEPIMKDPRVEDISCDGVNIPIYVYHRNPDVSSVQSNVYWETDEEMDAFVRKLAQRCGKTISMSNPLLDGALPDGSRVQATLGVDIARRGTNFTIRRFTDEPLTPVHLMESGSISPRILAYLWLCVENGKSILISGATASGKTTLLNALSLFIKPEMKVVSIEDTPELRLPHPNWVPEVSRSGFGSGEDSKGEVTMEDLLEESLRQRPDYIIVGEVRGEEAYILFQQIATGHPGMSTIHASNIQKVMDRLTTKPIDLPPSLIENLDVIIFPKRTRRQGDYVRRVGSIYEFDKYDKESQRPAVNKVFEWDAKEDVFINKNNSFILRDIVEDHGISVEKIQEEMMRRKRILQWLFQQEIKHYEEVGDIITTFYTDPSRILSRVETEVTWDEDEGEEAKEGEQDFDEDIFEV